MAAVRHVMQSADYNYVLDVVGCPAVSLGQVGWSRRVCRLQGGRQQAGCKVAGCKVAGCKVAGCKQAIEHAGLPQGIAPRTLLHWVRTNHDSERTENFVGARSNQADIQAVLGAAHGEPSNLGLRQFGELRPTQSLIRPSTVGRNFPN